MPKINQVALSKLLAAEKKQPSKAVQFVAKTSTARAERVIAIWQSIPAPSKKFPTAAEQEAYLEGVLAEKRRQSEYDNRLREEGLR